MPRGDGTGPWGMGPRTGRMSGYRMPGYDNPVSSKKFMAGFGQGRDIWNGSKRGRRFMNRVGRFFDWLPYERGDPAPAPMSSPDAEKRFLRTRAEVLQRHVDEIKKRLDELATPEF